MASTSVAAPAIDASFIDRKLVGPTTLNILKGAAWGNVVAISQAIGSSWIEKSREAKAAGKAVCPEEIKRLAIARTKVFWPVIVGTTAAFTVIRGNKDTTGITGMIKPLAIVSVPTIAYAAYYRAAPPQALTFGLLSCVFLHTFDRMLRPRGLFEENMPTTKLNRRTF